MKTEKMFETAVRNKFRFTFKGQISVEDLWDLSLKELDSIFKILNSQLKQTKEESLLEVKTKDDEILDTKIEIVKHIVNIKLEENNARLQEKEKKEQKQKILSILATKEEESLQNKTVEELTAMLGEL